MSTLASELRDALKLIADRGCESFVAPSWCGMPYSGRTPNAKYGADLMCAPCVARRALAVLDESL